MKRLIGLVSLGAVLLSTYACSDGFNAVNGLKGTQKQSFFLGSETPDSTNFDIVLTGGGISWAKEAKASVNGLETISWGTFNTKAVVVPKNNTDEGKNFKIVITKKLGGIVHAQDTVYVDIPPFGQATEFFANNSVSGSNSSLPTLQLEFDVYQTSAPTVLVQKWIQIFTGTSGSGPKLLASFGYKTNTDTRHNAVYLRETKIPGSNQFYSQGTAIKTSGSDPAITSAHSNDATYGLKQVFTEPHFLAYPPSGGAHQLGVADRYNPLEGENPPWNYSFRTLPTPDQLPVAPEIKMQQYHVMPGRVFP